MDCSVWCKRVGVFTIVVSRARPDVSCYSVQYYSVVICYVDEERAIGENFRTRV